MGSDELASLTEEKIADAIMTRIQSTKKRVAKRKQTLQGRKYVLAAQIKALETLPEEDDDNDDDEKDYQEDEAASKQLKLSRDVLFAPSRKI